MVHFVIKGVYSITPQCSKPTGPTGLGNGRVVLCTCETIIASSGL